MKDERYILQFPGEPEKEVTKQQWVAAERAAGFSGGRPGEPSTWAFLSVTGVRGRREYQ